MRSLTESIAVAGNVRKWVSGAGGGTSGLGR